MVVDPPDRAGAAPGTVRLAASKRVLRRSVVVAILVVGVWSMVPWTTWATTVRTDCSSLRRRPSPGTAYLATCGYTYGAVVVTEHDFLVADLDQAASLRSGGRLRIHKGPLSTYTYEYVTWDGTEIPLERTVGFPVSGCWLPPVTPDELCY